MNEIHTLDARGNVMLEVMQSCFNLNTITLNTEINCLHKELKEILKSKRINYEDLKTCLVPSIKKKELLLVFDRLKIKDMYYGKEVFEQILPLFDKSTSHSVLSGDYLGDKNQQQSLYKDLVNNLNNTKRLSFQYSNQFYFVYINNLSDSHIKVFHENLEDYIPYVGYVDLTYGSFFKTYTSMILAHSFIKYKSIIINSHEDDVDNIENINLKGYSFEKYGFKVKSLQSQYYELFLSYKIEREVLKAFEKDLEFSLNVMSSHIVDIKECEIIISDSKIDYLYEQKFKQFKKANVEVRKENLISTIKDKLLSNYIYSMRTNDHDNLIFNIILDIKNEFQDKCKMLVSLEYIPNKKELRLITMF